MKSHRIQTIFDDPIVKAVRKVREELAKEAHFDLHAICERAREAEQRELKDRAAGSAKFPPQPNT